MAVLMELQGGVLRGMSQSIEGRMSHVRGGQMVMLVVLMLDHVRGGEVAEGRGVLMEIRGKHGCDFSASVSTKIPPLEEQSSWSTSQEQEKVFWDEVIKRACVAKGGEWPLAAGCWLLAAGCWLMVDGRWLSASGWSFQGYVVKDVEKICRCRSFVQPSSSRRAS